MTAAQSRKSKTDEVGEVEPVEALAEMEAEPGDVLPDLPESAYAEDAVALPEQVAVVLVGNSYNGKTGDPRQVDAKRATELVAAGLARYAQSDTD